MGHLGFTGSYNMKHYAFQSWSYRRSPLLSKRRRWQKVLLKGSEFRKVHDSMTSLRDGGPQNIRVNNRKGSKKEETCDMFFSQWKKPACLGFCLRGLYKNQLTMRDCNKPLYINYLSPKKLCSVQNRPWQFWGVTFLGGAWKAAWKRRPSFHRESVVATHGKAESPGDFARINPILWGFIWGSINSHWFSGR